MIKFVSRMHTPKSGGLLLTTTKFVGLLYYEWKGFKHLQWILSLRKQQTFRDATTGLPPKWRLRNDRRSSILMTHHSNVTKARSGKCLLLAENVLNPFNNNHKQQQHHTLLKKQIFTIWKVPTHKYLKLVEAGRCDKVRFITTMVFSAIHPISPI